MRRPTRFSTAQIQRHPHAATAIDANGRILATHPGRLNDPHFHTKDDKGNIKVVRQKDAFTARAFDDLAMLGSAIPPNAPVNPPMPSDAGTTADYSKYPFMLPPFSNDQGTQVNVSACFWTAVKNSYAFLKPAVLWTNEKQTGANLYRSRIYIGADWNNKVYDSTIDIVTDATLPTTIGDGIGADGSDYMKIGMRHYAWGRTRGSDNTYASLNFGFSSQTMLDDGIFPETYSTDPQFNPGLVPTIMAALTSYPCIVGNTNGSTSDGIIAAHVYSIEGVVIDPDGTTWIIINNPWFGYGVSKVSLAVFIRNFGSVTIGMTISFPLDPAYIPYSSGPAPLPPAIPEKPLIIPTINIQSDGPTATVFDMAWDQNDHDQLFLQSSTDAAFTVPLSLGDSTFSTGNRSKNGTQWMAFNVTRQNIPSVNTWYRLTLADGTAGASSLYPASSMPTITPPQSTLGLIASELASNSASKPLFAAWFAAQNPGK